MAMDMISPLYDTSFTGIPFWLTVILALAFIVLLVRIITNLRRGKKAGVKNIISAGVVFAAGSLLAVYIYVNIITPPPPPPRQPMVSLVGYDYDECREIYAAYFDMEIEKEVYSSEYAAGEIIAHTPGEGMDIRVGEGSKVYCVVSRGRRVAYVPNVVGFDRETAEEVMEASGLTVNVEYEFSGDVPEGVVISADPGHNTEVYWGDCVTLVVSAGEGS